MLEKLLIPKNTKFDERTIVVEGDFIAGANSKIGYGIIAKKIILGEGVKVEGDVIGEEVRLDAFCSISGNVFSKGDAYIGEFASIDGKLTVYGDLEIGRNVRIKNGFEAKGLITIQNPLPIILFLFIYLMVLLRLGKLEEAEKIFDEFEEFENPMVVPENTTVEINFVQTSKDVEIVSSKVLGNIRGKNVYVTSSEVFGSVKGSEIIINSSRVHGAIEGTNVYVVNSSTVLGYVRATRVYMEERCIIDGSIVGRKGVWIKDKIEIKREAERDGDREREVQEDVSKPL